MSRFTSLFITLFLPIFITPSVMAQDSSYVSTMFRTPVAGSVSSAIFVTSNCIYATSGGNYVNIFGCDQDRLQNASQFSTRGVARSVAKHRGYVYVCADTAGLLIFDVTDPLHPVENGCYNTPGNAYQVVFKGDTAYVADGSSILTLNIQNPESPAFISSYRYASSGYPANYSHNTIFIQGRFLVASGSGSYTPYRGYPFTAYYCALFSLSGAAPVRVSALETSDYSGGSVSAVGISAQYVFVAAGVGIYAYTYTHPDTLSLAFSNEMSGTPVVIQQSGNLLLIAAGGAGFRVVDITLPAWPQEVGILDTYGSTVGFNVSGNRMVLADGSGGPILVDISNISRPQQLHSLSGYTAYYTKYRSPYLFATTVSPGQNTLTAFAQDSGYSQRKISQMPIRATPRCVALYGNYAYVVSDYYFNNFNISDPAHPEQVFENWFSGGSAVAISGQTLFLTSGESGLYSFDLTNPAQLRPLGILNVPGAEWGMAISGQYAYLACNTAGLQIVDISRPDSLQLVGSCDTPGDGYRVAVSGHFAYVADGSRGLRIIDVADPRHPVEVGSYASPGVAYFVAVEGHFAYIAAGAAGLRVIDVSDSSQPIEVGYYNTPGSAVGVDVVDGIAYVGDNNNLGVYDCSHALASLERFSAAQPSGTRLYPGYPNPFNASTTLSYSIAHSSSVSLQVFDVNGRKVATLVDMNQNPGSYRVHWNPERLPSGSYYVRLQTNHEQYTQKLVLLK